MPNNQNPAQLWFYNSGVNVSCPACGLAPGFTIDAWDTRIANGNMAWHGEQAAHEWWAEKYLYRKLKDFPDLLSVNQLMQNFMASHSASSLGALTELGYQSSDLFAFSAADLAQLQANDDDITEALAEVDLIDSTLAAGGLSESQVTTLLAERDAWLDFAEQKQSDNEQIVAQWLADRAQNADALLNTNTAISTNEDYDGNEKTLNDLYLRTIVKGIPPTLAQKAVIEDIGLQCPLTGGPGVFRSNAWHGLITGDYLAPGECHGGGGRSANRKESPKLSGEVRIYPNPSNGNFTIDYPFENEGVLAVFNQLGTEVVRVRLLPEKKQLNLSHLPSGVYYGKITLPSGMTRSKMLVIQQ
jgi:hypothetical protein